MKVESLNLYEAIITFKISLHLNRIVKIERFSLKIYFLKRKKLRLFRIRILNKR